MRSLIAIVLAFLAMPTVAQPDGYCALNHVDPENDPDCALIRAEIRPEQPSPFEPVHARLVGLDPARAWTVFDKAAVKLETSADAAEPPVIMVDLWVVHEAVKVDPESFVDVYLGQLPSGTYRFAIRFWAECGYGTEFGCGFPTPSLGEFRTAFQTFEVQPPRWPLRAPDDFHVEFDGEIPARIVYSRPSGMVNYSGMWYAPAASGTGLLIHHDLAKGQLVASWNVYGEHGEPTWFLFGPGTWTSHTEYAAPLYRTRGTPLELPYNPDDGSTEPAGNGTLRFVDPSRAELEFTLDGLIHIWTIARLFPSAPDFPDP